MKNVINLANYRQAAADEAAYETATRDCVVALLRTAPQDPTMRSERQSADINNAKNHMWLIASRCADGPERTYSEKVQRAIDLLEERDPKEWDRDFATRVIAALDDEGTGPKERFHLLS
jgi:hypothetical protein